MKLTINKITELKTLDICVVARDDEEANEMFRTIAKECETTISKRWKFELIAQTSAEEEYKQNFYGTITFEISSDRIEQTFDASTKKEMKEMYEKVKLIQKMYSVKN